jgi:hypothetical protein
MCVLRRFYFLAIKQLLHWTRVVCVVTCPYCPSCSMPLIRWARRDTILPFKCWVNTRTPENNPLKYLQSKNEFKFLSMVKIEPGTIVREKSPYDDPQGQDYRLKIKNVKVKWCSKAVTHPKTIHTRRCLTPVIYLFYLLVQMGGPFTIYLFLQYSLALTTPNKPIT